jgi:hypothetical protein
MKNFLEIAMLFLSVQVFSKVYFTDNTKWKLE